MLTEKLCCCLWLEEACGMVNSVFWRKPNACLWGDIILMNLLWFKLQNWVSLVGSGLYKGMLIDTRYIHNRWNYIQLDAHLLVCHKKKKKKNQSSGLNFHLGVTHFYTVGKFLGSQMMIGTLKTGNQSRNCWLVILILSAYISMLQYAYHHIWKNGILV